jgi:hypothetical protein
MGGRWVKEGIFVTCMTIDELVNSLNNQRIFPSGEKLAYIFRIKSVEERLDILLFNSTIDRVISI